MLKLRAVIDGSHIVELVYGQPAVIECKLKSTTVVITNGFHYSRTLELNTEPAAVYIYQVDCQIDNIRMFTGIFISLMLFSIYILIGLAGFMIAANLPILYMLYVFYGGRKDFIILNPVGRV